MSSHVLRGRALRLAALAACAALLAARALHAQPLTLHAAVRAAQERSLSLAAADSAARAAREMAVAAAQRPDPVLRAGVDNLPIEGADRFSVTRDFMTMRSIGVMQMFPREDKRRARAARFEREADAMLAEKAMRTAAVMRDTAIAWLERHAQEQRVELLRAQIAEAELQVQAAEAAARGGRGAPADWIAARDAVAQWRQALLGADAELANARRSLARWTGRPADLPLASPPPIDRSALLAHGPAERVEHHPELVQLAAREAAAAADAEVARQERKPDWSAELMYSQRGPAYANMVSFAVSIPVPWDRPQRQDRELAARLARVEELRDQRRELAREHVNETERWIEAWRAGLAQFRLIDDERLPLARQRTDASLAAYRGGSAPLAQVLEARRLALALQFERIAVELDTARLWARLEFLIPDTGATGAVPGGARRVQGVTQ
jgi:outer membrane protein TolC